MGMITKILLSVGVKLLTEKFLVAALIHIAEYLAKKTSNNLDDKIIAEVKLALGERPDA